MYLTTLNSMYVPQTVGYSFHLSKPFHLSPMLNLIGFLSYFVFIGLLLFKTVVCICLY